MAKKKESPVVPTYTHDGETGTAERWSKDHRCVVPLALIEARLARGWTIRQAIGTCKLPEENDG